MDFAQLAIGTELTGGLREETLGRALAVRLLLLDVRVRRRVVVEDAEREIEAALAFLSQDADAVLVTGGLGSTEDDVTRKVAARWCAQTLVYREEVLKEIADRLGRKVDELSPTLKKQALFPKDAKIIHNPVGSAPGFWMEYKKKKYFFLPGVPKETLAMFEEGVGPLIRKWLEESRGKKHHAVVYRTTGLNELEVQRSLLESQLGEGVQWTLCAGPEGVDIRLSASDDDSKRLEKTLNTAGRLILDRLSRFIYAEGEETLEAVVGKLLAMRGLTVALAESCTGGWIAKRLTDIAGASRWFRRGWVVYSDDAKTDLLNVPQELLEREGAVSALVARAMAEGARKKDRADLGLAVTGIAGPTGATPEKPVGLVYLALAAEGEDTVVRRCFFRGDRETVRWKTTQVALETLRRRLLGLPLEEES